MLKLKDEQKANVYGLPARDLDEAEALKLLANLGEQAQAHLESAIRAGAFAREEKREPRKAAQEVTNG